MGWGWRAERGQFEGDGRRGRYLTGHGFRWDIRVQRILASTRWSVRKDAPTSSRSRLLSSFPIHLLFTSLALFLSSTHHSMPPIESSLRPLVDTAIKHALAHINFCHQTLIDAFHIVTPITDAILDRIAHLSFRSLSPPDLIRLLLLAHLLAGLICILSLNLPPSPPTRALLPARRPASLSLPPHVRLLESRGLHPTTSLWPGYYLRAFNAAEKGDGVIRLDRRVVERDLRDGVVAVRGGKVRDGGH